MNLEFNGPMAVIVVAGILVPWLIGTFRITLWIVNAL